MYRRILVPLDGSELAERALPFAETVARQNGSQIVLIRAVEAHVLPGSDLPEAQRRIVQDAESYLATMAGHVGGPVTVETGVYYGAPAEGIVDEIHLRGADLVVMSTHGRSGFGRLLMGSVADEVLRHSPVPVMLVPATCDRTWSTGVSAASERPFRILVPLDGSSFSAEALGPVRDFARASHAAVTLMSAVELVPSALYAAAVEEQVRDVEPELLAMRDYLQTEAIKLAGVATDVSVHTTVGPASFAIAEYAQEGDFDLIAMATHGRGGLSRLVLGSVATGVLHQSKMPLLLVHPVGARERVEQPKKGSHPSDLVAAGRV